MSEESGLAGSSGIAATAMFVEVLVTGIGFLSAVSVSVLAVFKTPLREAFERLDTPASAAIFLSLSYVLGIVIDRVADFLLGRWSKSLREEYFPDPGSYLLARVKVSRFPEISAQSAYARSRMRVCRGWIVILPLLTIALDFWMGRVLPVGQVASRVAFCTMLGFILTGVTVFAWRSIVAAGYRQLAKEAATLG